jgi:hypothetical protein
MILCILVTDVFTYCIYCVGEGKKGNGSIQKFLSCIWLSSGFNYKNTSSVILDHCSTSGPIILYGSGTGTWFPHVERTALRIFFFILNPSLYLVNSISGSKDTISCQLRETDFKLIDEFLFYLLVVIVNVLSERIDGLYNFC